jgi:uncharacterized membrane protein
MFQVRDADRSAGRFATTAHARQIDTIDPPGATFAQANAVNVHGEIVGVFMDANMARHGFVRAVSGKNPFTTIDPPKSSGTIPTSINDSGQIAGMYINANAVSHGFGASKERPMR